MTYLSRIWLNPLRSGAQRLLRNAQAMHAAVLGGFPEQPTSGRLLWRLETTNRHRAELLVLSPEKPSWEHLVEQGGWPGAEDPQALVCDYAPLLERLTLGAEYAFRLRANPVSATRNPAAPSLPQKEYLASSDQPRGVRVPHTTVEHQLRWLHERLERWGFAALHTAAGDPQVQISARERLAFSKTGGDGQRHRVTLQTATYDGRITITDTTNARRALLDGVGHGRAYGCGLITLAPIPNSQREPR